MKNTHPPTPMDKSRLVSCCSSDSFLRREREDDGQVEELLAQLSDENLLNLKAHLPTQGFSSTSLHGSSASSDWDVLATDLESRLVKLKDPVCPPVRGMTGDARQIGQEGKSAKGRSDLCLSEQSLSSVEEEDALGAELAARLAALKAPSNPSLVDAVDSFPLARIPAVTSSQQPLPLPSEYSSLLPYSQLLETTGLEEGTDSESIDLDVATTESVGKASDGYLKFNTSLVEKLQASDKFVFDIPKNQSEQIKSSQEDGSGKLESSEEEISDGEVEQVVEWAKDAARLDASENEEDDLGLEEAVLEQDVILPYLKDDTDKKRRFKFWKFW